MIYIDPQYASVFEYEKRGNYYIIKLYSKFWDGYVFQQKAFTRQEALSYIEFGNRGYWFDQKE